MLFFERLRALFRASLIIPMLTPSWKSITDHTRSSTKILLKSREGRRPRHPTMERRNIYSRLCDNTRQGLQDIPTSSCNTHRYGWNGQLPSIEVR